MKQWRTIDWPVWTMIVLVLAANMVMGAVLGDRGFRMNHWNNDITMLIAFALFGVAPLLLVLAKIRRRVRLDASHHLRSIRSDQAFPAMVRSDKSSK